MSSSLFLLVLLLPTSLLGTGTFFGRPGWPGNPRDCPNTDEFLTVGSTTCPGANIQCEYGRQTCCGKDYPEVRYYCRGGVFNEEISLDFCLNPNCKCPGRAPRARDSCDDGYKSKVCEYAGECCCGKCHQLEFSCVNTRLGGTPKWEWLDTSGPEESCPSGPCGLGITWMGIGLIIAGVVFCCCICVGVFMCFRQNSATSQWGNVGEDGKIGIAETGETPVQTPVMSPDQVGQAPHSQIEAMPLVSAAQPVAYSQPLASPVPGQPMGGPVYSQPLAPPCNPVVPCYDNPLVSCDSLPDAMTEEEFNAGQQMTYIH